MLSIKTFIILNCVVIGYCAAFTLDVDQLWENFKVKYAKRYSALEKRQRCDIFKSNIKKIVNHNLEADLGKHSYTLGINEFADLEPKEFSRLYKGYKAPETRIVRKTFKPSGALLPEEVDWRKSNLVTPVKMQGPCGACWAFATTATLEGQHAKATGKLVSLSEQQLIDCATDNYGCYGGWSDWALVYIKRVGGLESEASYPYEAKNGNCRFNASAIGATMKDYNDVVPQNENNLQEATATIGPISVSIDVSDQSFQFYRSGVFDPPKCSTDRPDHAATVVGYGKDSGSGKDYWLLKNSWGTSWGEQGYFKLVRNEGNKCGVATFACYAVV